MKKHIFGFALFSLIVASFVLVYAFFSAPLLLSREAVKPPVSQTVTRLEKPYHCRLKENKFSFTVQNPELNFQQGKLISKLKLKWNGYGEPPKTVYVKARIFDFNQPDSVNFVGYESFSNSFGNNAEGTITFNHNFFNPNKELNEKNNFYVIFEVTDYYSKEKDFFDKSRLNEAVPVLTIFEKKSVVSSKINSKVVLKGTTIPQ